MAHGTFRIDPVRVGFDSGGLQLSSIRTDPVGQALGIVRGAGDGTDLVIVRSAVSLATQPNQFLRLEVTLP